MRTLCALSLLTALCTSACGPKLTMEGARVKVADSSIAATCMAVSGVEAQAGSHEAAEVLLRNKVGDMNANAVVVTENVDNGGEVMLIGKAYGCKGP